jgi:hypothetical protein
VFAERVGAAWPGKARGEAALQAIGRLAAGLGTAVLAGGALVLVLVTTVLCLAGVGLFLVPAALRTVRAVADRERSRSSRWGPEILGPEPVPASARAALRDTAPATGYGKPREPHRPPESQLARIGKTHPYLLPRLPAQRRTARHWLVLQGRAGHRPAAAADGGPGNLEVWAPSEDEMSWYARKLPATTLAVVARLRQPFLRQPLWCWG